MTVAVAQRTMAVLGRPGASAQATRIGGGRASDVYLVQADDGDVIAYLLSAGMAREARRRFATLERVAGVLRFAPKPLAVSDGDDEGSPLLLVERLGGVPLATCNPLSSDAVCRLATNFVAALAELHAIDIAPADRTPDALRRGIGEWQRRWNVEEAAGADDDFSAVTQWLLEHLPDQSPASLLHNDYKLDNVLVDPGDPARLVGIVDWELATIGHPLADLGIALAYWIESRDPPVLRLDAPGPSCVPGAPSRVALVDMYAAAVGHEVAQPAYWYVYGLWRLAVITQQLALRQRSGGERVPRSRLIVRLLLGRAADTCGSGRL